MAEKAAAEGRNLGPKLPGCALRMRTTSFANLPCRQGENSLGSTKLNIKRHRHGRRSWGEANP